MIIARAPLRISFGGGGTDLASYYTRFGGFVVSAAITRFCYVVAHPSAHGGIVINSADYHLCQTFEPGEVPPLEEPLALPKAAVDRFAEQGLRDRGVDLFLASDVSPGTGLGSSSAMAVALVRALAAFLHLPSSPSSAAELASVLEIQRLGKPIGQQDQYASAFGGLNAISFTAEGVEVVPLCLSPSLLTALRARLLLFSTGRGHDSSQILAQLARDIAPEVRTPSGRRPKAHQLKDRDRVAESLHRIKALAEDIRQALLDGDLDRFGQLLDLGWRQKRLLATNISSPTIDRWYAAARRAGALGGKITGAGGGGYLLLYCPPERQPALRATLSGLGLSEMPFDFAFQGATCYELRAVSCELSPADSSSPEARSPRPKAHSSRLRAHSSQLRKETAPHEA